LLFERSLALAEVAASAELTAEIELTRGIACLAQSQFTLAPKYLGDAHELLQTRCPDKPWLLTTTRMYLGSAWFYAGDYASIASRMSAWLEDAQARDDRYARAALTGAGHASVRHLMDDRPEVARAEIEEAMARWPEQPFSSVHFGALSATCFVLLYHEGRGLLDWLDGTRTKIGNPYLLRSAACRFDQHTLEGFGIARALQAASSTERSELLERGDKVVRALERNPAPAASGIAALLRGVLQGARGDRERALNEFREASRLLMQHGCGFGSAARYLEGLLEGGDAGWAKREAMLELLRIEGWADAQRALALRVPGLHLFT
jgi:tetratricopeptide (TPR) repeat protein